MDKVISLAREAGMGGDAVGWLASDHDIHKFYNLARADLEAEMQEQSRIIGMGGQREAKLLADTERLRTTLRNLLAYANSLEMHDANADGEHHVMQAARAALEER